ncbi:50S ribosomal protein L16 3-hydroxylase [Inhella inkyongensis]|uniref:50S ribosomal protein L16 3-hydroxylase n=1 Tax=Inhella inkyongensis TaxID=392593 RepID=A0A840S4R5_9BURK|nr:cupin domain-containing protein [Inhella inkyongensis]MBB5204026.1 50S ribosomal protein L16 3-hydroxylase [Inhella inkyongensis]
MKPEFDTPWPLLGALSPEQFMRRHWQRKPAVLRAAALPWVGRMQRQELFALAEREDVESRLVSGNEAQNWKLRQGPINRRSLPAVSKPGWTLLVQGMEALHPAARELLDAFRFLPEARLDDVMVSWASDQGGVGPHTDAYDVFLVQVAGRRRWRVSNQKQRDLVEGLPVKILRQFEPTLEWELEPGDILYLPPNWAHDGVALGADCITASVGLRAPSRLDLADALLPRLLDPEDDPSPALQVLYTDANTAPSATPAAIPEAFQDFALDALQRVLTDRQALARALGEYLSEPKPHQTFEPSEPQPGAVRLAPASRMLYDRWHVFLNGEAYCAAGSDFSVIKRLADGRELSAAQRARLSEGAQALLNDWMSWGWLCPTQ